MAKTQKRKDIKQQEVIKKKKSSKRNARKGFNNGEKTKNRKEEILQIKRQRRSISQKSKESNMTYSSENSDQNIYQILLPNEILSTVKKKLGKDYSLNRLDRAIKTYDIDDNIVYNYSDKCGKINANNMKYIYVLNCQNKKKIIKKYKIKNKIFCKSSKLYFYDFIQFISKQFIPNDKLSFEQLKSYKLENFERFIIPIFEGLNELKYYYFINIVFDWFKDPKQHVLAKNCIFYFDDFFNEKKNLNKIKEIFYIIFRIDLLFLNKTSEGVTILKSMVPSVTQTLEDIKKGLLLIQDEIEENINSIKITRRTSLTLNKSKTKFKAFYYTYSGKGFNLVNDIINKNYMIYEYFEKNKFNYFNSKNEINAFIDYVNKILSSNVIKEYYKKVESFQNYAFPFEKKEILEYL